MPYQMNRNYGSKILMPGSIEYELCRCSNPRGDTADQFPKEIHVAHHTDDVITAVKRASALHATIGVRAGGHTLSNPALYGDIMLDLSHLNNHVEYDRETSLITFGPSVRVKDLAETLAALDRFYPHGHCPSVASGGFHLGAGQGIAMRGWGPTYCDWLVKLEMVVPDGRLITASKTENADLFWAARGGGPAFFAVITKYWAKTIPRSNWWCQALVFRLGDSFKPLMRWFVQQSEMTPREGTELNALICYREKAEAKELPDQPPADAEMQFTVSNMAIADNESEARSKLAAYTYDHIPDNLRPMLISHTDILHQNLERMWKEQDYTWQPTDDSLWRFCSMSTGPNLNLDQVKSDPRGILDASLIFLSLLRAMKACWLTMDVCGFYQFLQKAEPRLLNIPTLRSLSLVVIPSWEPDEELCAFSIPTQLYLGSFAGWKDPTLTSALDGHWRKQYKDLLPFSSGMSPSDYDVEADDANSNPLSATALAKFIEIRGKWDPDELFPHYKKYITTSKKMAAVYSGLAG